MLLVLSKGKGIQSSSKQPLVGDERYVTTLITSAKETSYTQNWDKSDNEDVYESIILFLDNVCTYNLSYEMNNNESVHVLHAQINTGNTRQYMPHDWSDSVHQLDLININNNNNNNNNNNSNNNNNNCNFIKISSRADNYEK